MSLITFQKVQSLGLNFRKTQHTSVQVDGQSALKVVGETHTFYRGKIPLKFVALVVANIPMDLFGGTNFHEENDVSAQIAKNTISIKDKCAVIATSPTVLKMDKEDTRHQLAVTT